jgi:cystathionine beta-lyase
VPATFDFTSIQDRLAWSASKWEKYRGREVIPLWVADMDFAAPPAVQAALARHVAHGNYGYMNAPRELAAQLAADYQRRYAWAIEPEWIVWLPGLVIGLNLAVKTCCAPGAAAICFSPIYPPFLAAPKAQGCTLVDVPLQPLNAAETEFVIDFPALEAALRATPDSRLLLLSHPHNPIGRLFSRTELEQLADFCVRHDLYVCSDEIHADLILDGQTPHLPFGKLLGEYAPELLPRCITLHSPSKTYNIAGLTIAWAVIPDPGLRRGFRKAMHKLVPEPCSFGFTALQAILADDDAWRQALLAQLRENRDKVSAALQRMGLAHTHPEVTYLSWIDARALAARVGNPARWFEEHGAGLSDGTDFGRPGFLRLNFALPPLLLDEALARMEHAIASLG